MSTIDEINQLAFEQGQPAESGDGYLFSQEQFDAFAEAVIATFKPIIENLNDRHDLGVQERDRLRALLSAQKALSFENQRITPARFKCLACGDYHEGSGNLPCPKMSPMSGVKP